MDCVTSSQAFKILFVDALCGFCWCCGTLPILYIARHYFMDSVLPWPPDLALPSFISGLCEGQRSLLSQFLQELWYRICDVLIRYMKIWCTECGMQLHSYGTCATSVWKPHWAHMNISLQVGPLLWSNLFSNMWPEWKL